MAVRQKVMISIPSCARYQNIGNRIYCTANSISKKMWKHTTYYVERDEARDYRRSLSQGTVQMLGSVEYPRQWGSIIDFIIDQGCERCDTLIIMDDDLRIDHRPSLPEGPTAFEKLSDQLFDNMIDELCDITTYETPLTSVQYRQFCMKKIKQYQHNQRISMIWSLNTKFFREHPEHRVYRSSRLELLNDYYFFMNLLVSGHPNMVINRFTKDDKPNAPGGLAKRDPGVFNAAARQLSEMFPKYIKVYDKGDKTSWKDGFLGVKMLAHKAYKESVV